MSRSRELRKSLRQKRRNLSAAEQNVSNQNISRQLRLIPEFIKAKSVGFYWPTDGEVDISNLTRDPDKTKTKKWYLPLLSNELLRWERKRLLFQRFTVDGPQTLNRYGILEPSYDPAHLINPPMLDLVIFPLVGFDRHGNRLGMGQGYYDRTFARRRTRWHKPTYIGLAHKLQECADLRPAPWDIGLDMIITDHEVIYA